MSQIDVDSKAAPGGSQQADAKKPKGISRRSFLKSSGLAAIGITAVSGVGLAAAAPAAAAALNYSESFSNLGTSNGEALVRMARDIFPHDKLPDELYAAAVASYDQKAASDNELKVLITSGIANLDAVSEKRYGKRYTDVTQEEDRLEVLYAIEDTAFFQKIKSGLVTGLYNNKAAWPLLGYEGSSWEKGGYLDRGFNDLDWL